MLAICLEASHSRGLGHLFRSIRVVEALQRLGVEAKILVNDYPVAIQWIRQSGHEPLVVDPRVGAGWEEELIKRFRWRTWVNDRLDTDAAHAQQIKKHGLSLATFDDRGTGAALADLHIAALSFSSAEQLGGRRVLRGLRYLVLDPALQGFRRVRNHAEHLLVTCGGADTHGITPRVVSFLRRAGRTATVVTGPGFVDMAALEEAAQGGFAIRHVVPSLAQEFSRHDLAITTGGLTPFEANATGLPCIIIAAEQFEVPVAQQLTNLGGCVYAGHHSAIDEQILLDNHPVRTMSVAALAAFEVGGAERVARELAAL